MTSYPIKRSAALMGLRVEHYTRLRQEQVKPFVVYALKHPVKGGVAYFGATANVALRYYGHIRVGDFSKKKKDIWVYGLIKNGLLPYPEIIAQYDTRFEALSHEYKLIKSQWTFNISRNSVYEGKSLAS